MTASGPRDLAGLRATEARMQAVYPRRLPVGLAVLAAMAATGLALVLTGHRRAAARVAALLVLWVPALALLAAALAPSRTGEIALVAGGAVVLAALTDRIAGWPRGAAVPALAGVVAYVVDLAFGSTLIVRSLLGPNPRFGSRFYGIGNELESVLPVLLLIGMAALAGRRPRSRGLAAAFGAAMLALGVLVGAGRLGADVGGVVSIAAAGAVAVLLLLPGGVSRRAVAVAVTAPVTAVLLLAGIDLATGGDAHFSRTILGARSVGDVLETLGRRYDLAWHALTRGLMPLATLIALGLGALAVRRRRTLYAGVRDAPAWTAALAGGLTGAVTGALANDSGPILLVIGVALLADATLYLRGGPADARNERPEAGRSRARARRPPRGPLGSVRR